MYFKIIDGSKIMNFEKANLMNLRVHQFPEICRTCLVQGVHKPMFEIVYNQKSLSDILKMCTTLQVRKEDYLPQNICSSCLLEIFQMYSFVQKCQESDAILRYIINLSLKTDQSEETSKDNDEFLDNTELLDVASTLPGRSIRTRKRTEKILTHKVFTPHDVSSTFNCKQCGECFPEQTLLKEHNKSTGHSKVHTLPCSICSKLFTNSKLRQHMRTHTKEKPYKCKICLQGFSLSGNLKRHMMTHTGERPYTCEFCGKGFIQATTLDKHKKTHSRFEQYVGEPGREHIPCNHCGRVFKRLSRYHVHIKRHESKTEEVFKTVDSNEKPYEYMCTICSRPCKTKHLLKAHERTHGEKSFLCNECGKCFVTNAALQSHLRMHTGEKPHTCNICNKAFAHVGSFEAHVLIHTGQKPYHCTVCSRAFTQLTHLKYHARTHSGERPYVCNYCEKSFALKGNLTVHTRTHTGETPYVCSVCRKGFHDSSSLKKHKKIHCNNSSLNMYPIQSSQLPRQIVSLENNFDVNQLGYATYHYSHS